MLNWNFETILTSFFVFFSSGVISLILDRKFGESFYRFGYRWTHKDPLPEGVEVGFLFGHDGLGNKLRRAAWIVAIGMIAVIYFGHESILSFALIALVGVPSAALGLKAGPWFGNIFDHSGEYIKKVEDTAGKISSGEILPSREDLRSAVAKVAAHTADAVVAAKEVAKDYLPEFGKKEVVPEIVLPQVAVASPEQTKEETLEAAQAAVDRFVKKSAVKVQS